MKIRMFFLYICLNSLAIFAWEFIGPVENLNICNLYSFGNGHLLAFEGEINNRDPYLFRSKDYGKTWDTLKNTGLFDSQNFKFITWYNNELWAGDWQNGIFVSKDSGNTWKSNNASTRTFSFATKDNYFLAGSYCAFFRSEDYGKNWEVIYTPQVPFDFGAALSMMEFRGIVYAGTQFGIFASKDWGRTWEKRGKNYNSAPGATILSLGRIDTLFFFSSYAAIYKSYNLGLNDTSWIFTFDTEDKAFFHIVDSSEIYVCDYDRSPNITRFYYSSDTGKTFKPFSITTPENYCYSIQSDDKYVYVMTDKGIYKNLKKDSPTNIVKKNTEKTKLKTSVRFIIHNKSLQCISQTNFLIEVSLYTLKGQKIFSFKNNNTFVRNLAIALQHFKICSGVYIVSVITDKSIESQLITI